MKHTENTSWKRILLFFGAVAVFYLYIAFQVPYTGDDWDWGLDIGLQHLLTADINSRYAGNFLVVIMTRSKLMQTLLMGSAYFALPMLMVAIVTDGQIKANPKRSVTLFLAANCLLLSMGAPVWQQTYGWISGFANYGFSAVLLEVCLFLTMPLFRREIHQKDENPLQLLSVFLLGMVIQLFLENLAIFMVLFGMIACAVSYLREKRIQRRYLALFAGTVIGLVIMFSNTIYTELFHTGMALGNGRKMVAGGAGGLIPLISGALENFSREIATLIWENNVVICCSISALLMLLWLNKRETGYKTRQWMLMLIDLLSIPYFIVFSQLEYGKFFLLRFGLLDAFELLVNLGYFAVVAVQVVLLFRDRFWKMWKLLLIWAGAPAVILPLTVVLDEGGRFYITSNVLLIIFTLFLLDAWLRDLSPKAGETLLLLGASVLISFSLFYFFLYWEIGVCTQERMQIIAQARQTGEKHIELPAYPYLVRDYVWWGEPGEAYREVYFREFFSLDQDVKMTFWLE